MDKGGEILIDTIAIQSPFLTEKQYDLIEKFCQRFVGIELMTGESLYEFTKGQLKGSYDSRISLQLKRDMMIEAYNSTERKKTASRKYFVGDNSGPGSTKWKEYSRDQYSVVGKKTMISVECQPYLIVECSVHKAMLGHNAFGGPIDYQLSVKWLVNLLEEFIGIELPLYTEWLSRRIDFAQIFDLGSFEAVQSWVSGMNHCHYPRRKVSKHGLESIYIPSSKTTLKCYHKGPEFYKHDRKRLLKYLSKDKVNDLQIKANSILRIELEIKSKKLREFFNGELPSVKLVTQEILATIYDREVFKLLREAQDSDKKEIFRTSDSVIERLGQIYSENKRLCRVLYTTWLNLATNGEEKVKLVMSKTVFYKHRKLLIDANISWLQTDILLNQEYSLVPLDFKPIMNDSRRLAFEDEVVIDQLKKVA